MRVRGIPISFQTNVDGTGLAVAMLLGLGCAVPLRSGAGAAARARRSAAPPRELEHASRAAGLRNILMAVEVALAVVVFLVAAARSSEASRPHAASIRDSSRDGVLLAAYDLTGRPVDEADSGSSPPAAGEAARSPRRSRRRDRVGGAARHPWSARALHQRRRTAAERGRSPTGRSPMTVTPGYFDVMGIPLLQGNGFRRSRRSRRAATGHRQRGVRASLPRSPRAAGTPRRGAGDGVSSSPAWHATRSTTRSASRRRRSCTSRTAIGRAPSARFTCARGWDRETALAPDLRRIVQRARSRAARLRHPDAERSHRVEPDLPSHAGADVRRPRAAAARARGHWHLRGRSPTPMRSARRRSAFGWHSARPSRRVVAQHVGESLVVVGVGALGWLDDGVLFRDAQLARNRRRGSSSARSRAC